MAKKAEFTLRKNDVHIKCTEKLKQCHVFISAMDWTKLG